MSRRRYKLGQISGIKRKYGSQKGSLLADRHERVIEKRGTRSLAVAAQESDTMKHNTQGYKVRKRDRVWRELGCLKIQRLRKLRWVQIQRLEIK